MCLTLTAGLFAVIWRGSLQCSRGSVAGDRRPQLRQRCLRRRSRDRREGASGFQQGGDSLVRGSVVLEKAIWRQWIAHDGDYGKGAVVDGGVGDDYEAAVVDGGVAVLRVSHEDWA
ncbi:hypothetical protein E2562_031723 [Oryza meyeriana var. granulata]|uniref:Uncharacterized protein n=1 Tax=Oryza meyeriana var. granulata TaxID=110450 RepID=A0A6G1FEB4_9ORYZ|nr:hypothetical protein E2562_031723 [Oryza meyeriana var. granulata]